MAYKDYIKSEQQKWIGRTVYYEGQRYMVVDVDYNGGLLINKPTMFTDTTAVESWQVIYNEEYNDICAEYDLITGGVFG